jgi:hypothetical protein
VFMMFLICCSRMSAGLISMFAVTSRKASRNIGEQKNNFACYFTNTM